MDTTINSLTFGYDPVEDRLVITAGGTGGQGTTFQMTRRLSSRWLNGVAQLLKASSAVARQAPDGMRDDIILLEHQNALAAGARAPASAAAAATAVSTAAPQPAVKRAALAANISISTFPTEFALKIDSADGTSIGFRASRFELHRILECLKLQAQRAEWSIEVAASWLEPAPSEMTLN